MTRISERAAEERESRFRQVKNLEQQHGVHDDAMSPSTASEIIRAATASAQMQLLARTPEAGVLLNGGDDGADNCIRDASDVVEGTVASAPAAATPPHALRQMQRIEHDTDLFANAEMRSAQNAQRDAHHANKAAVLLGSAEQRMRRSRVGTASPSTPSTHRAATHRGSRRTMPSSSSPQQPQPQLQPQPQPQQPQQQQQQQQDGVWYKERMLARRKANEKTSAVRSGHSMAPALALSDGSSRSAHSESSGGGSDTNFGLSAGHGHLVVSLQSSAGSGALMFNGLANAPECCPMPHRVKIAAVSAGHRHTAFLLKTGELLTAGVGTHGRLGHGDTAPRNVPAKVTALTGKFVAAISAGGAHTAAVLESGGVMLWGKGGKGQQGNARFQDQLIPSIVHVTHDRLPSVRVACGADHTLVITAAGSVYSLGHKAPAAPRFVAVDFPVRGQVTPRVVDIAAGGAHSVAVLVDGDTYAWGDNASGQLGQGDFEPRELPVLLRFPPPPVGREGSVRLNPSSRSRVVAATCGVAHTLVLSDAGLIYSCGAGTGGCLGQGDEANAHTLQVVQVAPAGGSVPVRIAAGGSQSAAITTDGELFVWGQRHGSPAQLQPCRLPLDLWSATIQPAAMSRIDAAIRSAKGRPWDERLQSLAQLCDRTSDL